jgi:methylmalonyl-CoA mutase N-terminal domain/subunit
VRIAYQALAAVLGGVQTLATSAYDEAIQLPSEEAAQVSLRTQQILAYETGVTRTADPLAGSYYVESLCRSLEERVVDLLAQIDEIGGALKALETGWIGSTIDDEAYRQQQAIDSGDRVVVGVNRFGSGQAELRHRHRVDPALEQEQVARLQELRARRDDDKVKRALAAVRAAAAADENTIPALRAAIDSDGTIGEVCSALKDVWGVHTA